MTTRVIGEEGGSSAPQSAFNGPIMAMTMAMGESADGSIRPYNGPITQADPEGGSGIDGFNLSTLADPEGGSGINNGFNLTTLAMPENGQPGPGDMLTRPMTTATPENGGPGAITDAIPENGLPDNFTGAVTRMVGEQGTPPQDMQDIYKQFAGMMTQASPESGGPIHQMTMAVGEDGNFLPGAIGTLAVGEDGSPGLPGGGIGNITTQAGYETGGFPNPGVDNMPMTQALGETAGGGGIGGILDPGGNNMPGIGGGILPNIQPQNPNGYNQGNLLEGIEGLFQQYIPGQMQNSLGIDSGQMQNSLGMSSNNQITPPTTPADMGPDTASSLPQTTQEGLGSQNMFTPNRGY